MCFHNYKQHNATHIFFFVSMRWTARTNLEIRGDNNYETSYAKTMQDRDDNILQYARPLGGRRALLITLRDVGNRYAWRTHNLLVCAATNN